MKFIKIINLLRYGVLVGLMAMYGCSNLQVNSAVPRMAYIPAGEDDLARNMPIIFVEHPEVSYNLIGEPVIYEEDARFRLLINTENAVAYGEIRPFETERGRYINYIYRIHFDQVPFSLLPFNLTMGENVGLIFIVTTNEQQQPLLITSVHTCGCYLAFVPTSNLTQMALPESWNLLSQHVYGAALPGLLTLNNEKPGEKISIFLRSENHRVINLKINNTDEIASEFRVHKLPLRPMADLERLKLPGNGNWISMYEPDGRQRGYVRGSSKPFEFLLMSWWSLDSRVGMDKRYGQPGDYGPVFYTSLKPWARQQSDMRDFPRFLDYWGWRL